MTARTVIVLAVQAAAMALGAPWAEAPVFSASALLVVVVWGGYAAWVERQRDEAVDGLKAIVAAFGSASS